MIVSWKGLVTILNMIRKEDNLKVVINRKPEDIAYLAGYVDADGSICLIHRKPKNVYRPVLTITASRRDILEEIQAMANFGGIIWTDKNNKRSSRYISKLIYTDLRACKFCEMIQPYLRLKGAQAALLTQVGHFRAKHRNGVGVNVDAYYVPRYEEMKRLNEGNKSEKVR